MGSGLKRFLDTPLTMQRRLLDQGHIPNQLPEGVLAWDLAHDKAGRVTNRLAANTFVTQGVQTTVTFNTPMSSSGMCYVSILGLQYIDQAGL